MDRALCGMMPSLKTDWPALLRAISEHLIEVADDIDLKSLTEQQRKSTWLGAVSAGDAAIAQREATLGLRFPDDYRAFLLASNGFTGIGQFPYGLCHLDSVEEIDTFAKRDERTGRLDPFILDGFVELFDDATEHAPLSAEEVYAWIMIGESDGNECILLRPPSGERPWQLWIFDNEQGLEQLGCFADLMLQGPGWMPAYAGG